MVTYHYHRMDVINFVCSFTAFRKPSLAEKVKTYFLHLKPETASGKFSYQETNLSSRSAAMQKTLQSPLFLLQPTSHLQHPDVELLTLHIQLLLYFSKTSQFLLGCYDIRIAMCITICTQVATYCAVSQTLQLCYSSSYEFIAGLSVTKWKYRYNRKVMWEKNIYVYHEKVKGVNFFLCEEI